MNIAEHSRNLQERIDQAMREIKILCTMRNEADRDALKAAIDYRIRDLEQYVSALDSY